MNIVPMTTEEVVRELRREIAVRERVYPRWVYDGKIDEKTASHRLSCLYAALTTLERSLPQQADMFNPIPEDQT